MKNKSKKVFFPNITFLFIYVFFLLPFLYITFEKIGEEFFKDITKYSFFLAVDSFLILLIVVSITIGTNATIVFDSEGIVRKGFKRKKHLWSDLESAYLTRGLFPLILKFNDSSKIGFFPLFYAKTFYMFCPEDIFDEKFKNVIKNTKGIDWK